MVEAQVGRDAVDPGVERALKAEVLQIPVSFEKGLLMDILRVLLRAGEPECQPQNRAVVLADQCVKRSA